MKNLKNHFFKKKKSNSETSSIASASSEQNNSNLEVNIQDWTDIHENFSKEYYPGKTYQQLWEENSFTHQEVKEWTNVLGENFELSNNWAFCVWIRDEKHLIPKKVQRQKKLESLREEYNKFWTDLHEGFVPELQKKWEEEGLTYQEVKKWIQVGFKPDDYNLIEEWKKSESDFETVKQWAYIGFKPSELEKIKEWKNHDFTFQQVKSWTNIGLDKGEDIKFATYLKLKNHQPNPNLDLEQLREEFETWQKNPPVQEYLDVYYPRDQRKVITELNIKEKILQGDLDLSDFVNLEELNCGTNKLTSLNLDNCSKLRILRCYDNQLKELKINHLVNLEELGCSSNQLAQLDLPSFNQIQRIACHNNSLKDLSFLLALFSEKLTYLNINDNIFPERDLSVFSRFINLKSLELGNNEFYGSLEPLKNMAKLETLNINNVDLDSGLEYLPNSIKKFYCSAEKRKDAKCKVIYNLFADEWGKVETENYEQIKNFPQKLQDYKQWRKLNFSEEEIKQWINAGLVTISRYGIAEKWKEEFGFQGTKELIKVGFKIDDLHQAKNWKDKDLSVQQVVEWVNAGFKLQDSNKVLKWKEFNFTEKEAKSWIKTGLENTDFDFANYLKKERKLTPQTAKNRLTELRNEYTWWQKGFTLEQRKEWINAGAKADDYEFIAWLRDTKKETPQWITNYKEDYQVLSSRFKKYGLCPECKQPNTGEKWCKECNAKHAQEHFEKKKGEWKKTISDNLQVDEFIKKYQSEATDKDKFIEWIPNEQFKNIEFLAEGGFGKVYKAKWKKGNISYWDNEKKQWHREKDIEKDYREVVLKSLNNSSKNIDFLQETEKHKIIDDWFSNIVPCYGLSQDPETKNYVMVMQYMPEGNLRDYLSNKNKELNLQDKLNQLVKITQGLKDIHSKNLVHCDFHSGNILKGIEKTSCLITDLGLCKPVDEINKEDKVFGVMPYVAPEVLLNKPYTQASDIYSFGIIAYEVLTGLPPYYDKAHDVNLALEICDKRRLRPGFNIRIPQLLKDLIKRCWDNDPQERPTANDLESTLRGWQKEIQIQEFSTLFTKQLQESEEYNKTLPEEIRFPKYEIHYGAIYHSKLLPTKEIARILGGSKDLDLEISADLDQQIQEQQPLQIQPAYGTPGSSKPK